jgi:hypothetical protein
MYSMRRPIVIAVVLLILAGTAFVYRYGDRLSSRLTVEGRRDRVIRRLNDREILIAAVAGWAQPSSMADGGAS